MGGDGLEIMGCVWDYILSLMEEFIYGHYQSTNPSRLVTSPVYLPSSVKDCISVGLLKAKVGLVCSEIKPLFEFILVKPPFDPVGAG